MGCSGSCSGGCPSQEEPQEQGQEQGPEVLVDIRIRLGEDLSIFNGIAFESLHVSGRMVQFQDREGFLRVYLLADSDSVEMVSVRPLPQ